MKQLLRALKHQLLLLLILVFLIIGSSFFFVLESTLGKSIQALELTYAKENLTRVHNALDVEASMLEAIAGDYAAWDDTYQYLLDRNPAYIEANILDSSLSNIDVDLIVYFDKTGSLIYGTGIGMPDAAFKPIGDSLTSALNTLKSLANESPQFEDRGILNSDGGIILYGLRPIIKSDLSGPVQGHLLMGRYLDQDLIAQISQKLQLKVAITALETTEASTASDSTSGTALQLSYGANDRMSARASLTDRLGNEVSAVRIDMTRDFSVALRKSKQTILMITLVLSLLSTAMIGYFLDRRILKRLTAIQIALGGIGDSTSHNYSLPTDASKDEIAFVVDAMNDMLSKIHTTQLEVELSREKYRMFVENGRDVIFSLNQDANITYISPNCDEVMGIKAETLIGGPFSALLDPSCTLDMLSLIRCSKETTNLQSVEFHGKSRDLTWRWYRLDLSMTLDNTGERHWIGIFYDIHPMKLAEQRLQASHDTLESLVKQRTRQLVESNHDLENQILLRQRAQEHAERLAYYDPLTDLPNRTLLGMRIDHAIELAERIQKPFGVLYMDLDGFKAVNDTMGHEQGDQLLKDVSHRLTKALRISDTVARMGGDEFLVLVQNLEHEEHIHILGQKLLDTFKEPFQLDRVEVFVTASIGASVYPLDGTTKEDLIKHADLAMYKAKDSGKNQYVACNSVMKAEINEKMQLSNSLYRALERNEFELYYQPQVCKLSHRITGMEALLRWHHPELGMISPGLFIELAEQTGLIIPIGQWVLETACAQCKTWQHQGLKDLRMAVNLSVIQFQSQNIVQQVASILEQARLEPQFLELEITESVAMRDKEYVIRVLNDFRAMGVKIAIDDFGTDYSSLAYLKLLPVNRIKIPMPFIQGIDNNQRDKAIAKSIIVLTHSMDMEVLAEGVETLEQAQFLRDWDCDDMQGYLFYKPMPSTPATQVLTENAQRFTQLSDNVRAPCLSCRHNCHLATSILSSSHPYMEVDNEEKS